MNKKLITLLLAAGIAVIFLATGLQAGTEVGDVVTMESKVIKKRKKSPEAKKPTQLVQFTHKKHSEEYKLTCGDCHHDKDGKPLADLKAGDDVQKCDECHNRVKAVKKDKTFQGVYKKKPVDILQLEAAMHENCVGCHKKMKVEAGTKCGDCHKKM
ncbi:MAG: cytochrome c3 family protein [Desulfobacter sp.]|nr:cytochrome c3 family protein [Desulfobacter sp.]WDP85036.1 MAG: cytochrome c3 family protein [Desulfobacter sp.]